MKDLSKFEFIHGLNHTFWPDNGRGSIYGLAREHKALAIVVFTADDMANSSRKKNTYKFSFP